MPRKKKEEKIQETESFNITKELENVDKFLQKGFELYLQKYGIEITKKKEFNQKLKEYKEVSE